MKRLNLVDTTKFAARVIVKAFGNVLSLSNLKRLTVLHVISALLLPMFWFVAPQKSSAQFAPAAITPPPPSAPPAAFLLPVTTSSNIFSGLFGASEDAGTNDKSSFSALLRVLKTPELPAGLAAGRVPPLTERVSEALRSSSAFAKVAPLFSNESAAPEVSAAETFVGKKPKSSVKANALKELTEDSKESLNRDAVNSEASESAPETETEVSTAPLSSPVGGVRFDFDGDGKADQARRKGSSGEWKIRNSNNGNVTTLTVGTATSLLTPGDFDGDGKTDAAIFDAGTWTIKQSSNGQTVTASWGTSGDKPVTGNYDGDGKSDLAVFRPSTNTWWILQSSNGATVSASFGASGDILVPADYDGDNKTDVAVFRPSTGYWHVQASSAGYFGMAWGLAADIPVPADYDGDGKADLTVYRGSTGSWYAHKSSTNNGTFLSQNWGNYGDQPVPADYDGDGTDDFAVFRPNTGVWHIIKSGTSQYEYQTLGQAGDTAVNAAYLKQIGGSVHSYDLAKARLSPKNATGGTNLYSQNFAWGTSLVGLTGRAGLDAGFGMSYNSLIWTKYTDASNNSSVFFDTDNANVSPGFRFGFPTIEPIYWDKNAQTFNYLMVTPSGARVEFRQVGGASDTFETADSSYLQLKTVGAANPNDAVENITLTVTGTDGTKMTYLWKGGAFRCSEIKDRNGNYITITHDAQGLLRSVTDTLGRIINVNYDNELSPVTITQTWKDSNGAGANRTHIWATFTYTTKEINTNFASNISVFGPQNGTTLKVLQKITYPDGSATAFDYNGYGQVYKVRNIAADASAHVLNYVRTNLETPSTNQTDCPRLTETRNWVENFNLNQQNAAQETIVTNSIQANQSYSVGGVSGTATKIEVTMADHPHGAVSKTYVGGSGWMEGLQIATEDWANGTSGSERKRWTWMNWTQDNTNLSYIQNPRVTESKVGDTTNIKRSTTEYRVYPNTTIAEFGLVNNVKVYDADQTTVLKQAETDYNFSSSYTSRRIIGLPSEVRVYGRENSSLPLVSKVSYNYDEGNFNDTSLEQNPANIVQHDNTNYGSSFIIGRANPTSTTRYDVTGQTASVSIQVKFNTAGLPVAQIDPVGRTVKTSYADSFNDNQNHNTFAYPTKVYDPANNYSEVKYRFDIGANVWAKSPAPAGNTTGKETTRLYDSIGRLDKETLVNTGAYTRYEYPTNQVQSKVYTTIIDTGNDGVDVSDEVMSEAWADGVGRVRKSRTLHPGSQGQWTGSMTEYDILGQVKRSTIPTEINSSFVPTGDDNRGVDGNGNPIWLWTQQVYDWKGRVVEKTNTDGTYQSIDYQGCGCAGGQVTTVQNELVPQNGNPSLNGRRTQKIYEDILGRAFKTEVLNWNGSVYSSTVNFYNGRDQIIQTRQFDGSTSSGTYRDIEMSYDGHGRMKTRHYPIEDPGTNTAWNYNNDDTIQNVIDPRGVKTNFSYNTKGLLETISYDPQSSGVADTSDVTYAYDALGNRTSMSDGTGSTAYTYNSLSQITSETKTINDLSNSFTFNYTYALNGNLKSISDPLTSNQQAVFNFDKTGRTLGAEEHVSGNSVQSVSNTKFRAWGAIKELQYDKTGSFTQYSSFSYDNRLLINQYQLTQNQSTETVTFERYADGKLKNSTDSAVTWKYRSYLYDHAGRLSNGLSGQEASNDPTITETPYQNNISYNSFGESTTSGKHWVRNITTIPYSIAATTGRINTSVYDAAGNVTQDRIRNAILPQITQLDRTLSYDAAGRMIQTFDPKLHNWEFDVTVNNKFDGNGWQVRNQRLAGNTEENIFEIRSTVLGGEVVGRLRIYQNVEQKRFIVPVNGRKLVDDSALGRKMEWTAPEGIKDYSIDQDLAILDVRGSDVGVENPYNTSGGDGGASYPNYGDPTNAPRCAWDNLMIPCGMKDRLEVAEAKVWIDMAKDAASTDAKKGGNISQQSQHDSGTAKSTRNTQKPSDDPDKGSAVPQTALPSDDGSNEVVFIQQVNSDGQVSFDEAAGLHVQSQGIDPDHDIRVNANDGLMNSTLVSLGSYLTRNCNEHKNFLQKTEVRDALQKAWTDSKYGTDDQKEQGGLFIQKIDPDTLEYSKVENITFTRPENSPANTLQGYGKWAISAVSNRPNGSIAQYAYHTHPFKGGVEVKNFTSDGKTTSKFTFTQDIPEPSDPEDFDSLTDINTNTDSSMFGIVIGSETVTIYNNTKIVCAFGKSAIWK